MFIPDPTFFHPGSELSPSRIRIKEFKYFNPKKPKKWFLSSRKYDPGCSSRIRMLTFYPSRIQGSKRHRIPDLQHWFFLLFETGKNLDKWCTKFILFSADGVISYYYYLIILIILYITISYKWKWNTPFGTISSVGSQLFRNLCSLLFTLCPDSLSPYII